jgi:ATP-binding cassette subfamily B protein
MSNRVFFTSLTLVASLATALVYGVGGVLAIDGSLTVGTLLGARRAAQPALRAAHRAVERPGRRDDALVSFERVFEVLDLAPAIREADDGRPAAGRAPRRWSCATSGSATRRPTRSRWPPLEQVARPDRGGSAEVLGGISLSVAPGQLVALVGPSGGGQDDDHQPRRAAPRPDVRQRADQRRRSAVGDARVGPRHGRRRDAGGAPVP